MPVSQNADLYDITNDNSQTVFIFPLFCDDGHGDYNQSYDKGYDDFDYADYSTGKEDNNFRTKEKKKRKSQKQIIDDILNRWD